MAKAMWNGQTLAESEKIQTVEGNVYFPEETVNRSFLKPSSTSSRKRPNGVVRRVPSRRARRSWSTSRNPARRRRRHNEIGAGGARAEVSGSSVACGEGGDRSAPFFARNECVDGRASARC